MSGAAAVWYAFSAGRDGGRKVLREGPALAPAPSERLPRIARLLALAHRFQGMLDRGEVASMADIARLGRVTRARVTQIMDLLLLAPDIQEEVLFLPATESGRDAIMLREMRAVCAAVEWKEQRERWKIASRFPSAEGARHRTRTAEAVGVNSAGRRLGSEGEWATDGREQQLSC